MAAGDVIRELREAADLTQEEVAAALRVSNGAVSQWETGRTSPRRAVATRLDALVGGEGRVLAALGYAMPTERADEFSRLREVVAAQGLQIQELAQLVERLGAELARQRGRGRAEGG